MATPAAGSDADQPSGFRAASEQAKWLYGQDTSVVDEPLFDEGGVSGYRVRRGGRVTETVIIVDSGKNIVGRFRLQSLSNGLEGSLQILSAVTFNPQSLEQDPRVRKLLSASGMEYETHDGILLVTSPIPEAELHAFGSFHVVAHLATEDARFVAMLPDWKGGETKTLAHPEDAMLRVDTLSGEIVLRRDGSTESALVMFHRVRSEEPLAAR